MGRYFKAELDSIVFQIFIDKNKLTIYRANGEHAEQALKILLAHLRLEVYKSYRDLMLTESFTESYEDHNSGHPCQDPLSEAEHVHTVFNRNLPDNFEQFILKCARELEKNPQLRDKAQKTLLKLEQSGQNATPSFLDSFITHVYDYLSPAQIDIPFDPLGPFNFINPDEPMITYNIPFHYEGCFPAAPQALTPMQSGNISQAQIDRQNHNYKEQTVGPAATAAVALLCCTFWGNKIRKLVQNLPQSNTSSASKKMQ